MIHKRHLVPQPKVVFPATVVPGMVAFSPQPPGRSRVWSAPSEHARISVWSRTKTSAKTITYTTLPGPCPPERHGTVRQGNPPDQPRAGDAAFVPRLRHERHRGTGPAGRAGRPEAR